MAKPVVITRQARANGAAQEYAATYGGARASFKTPNGRETHDTIRALRDLGPTPAPDDVDALIGNESWTRVPACDGCGARTDRVVQVGAEVDYESATAVLCGACLRAALTAYQVTP